MATPAAIVPSLGVKRRFGDGDEDDVVTLAPAVQAVAGSSRGIVVHPSRLAVLAPQTISARPTSEVPPAAAPVAAAAPPAVKKEKKRTEAQSRYKKKKQNKLKLKKQAAARAAPKNKAAPSGANAAQAAGSDEDDEDEDVEMEEPVEAVKVETKEERKARKAQLKLERRAVVPAEASQEALKAVEEPAPKKSKKEKKRRDASPSPAPSTSSIISSSSTAPAPLTRQPTPPPPSLPAFPTPAPSQPLPTSRELHPLTLPHALTLATRIPASLTSPLSSAPLSERMKARLADLGVESFFAVQTGVIPFLLGLDPSGKGKERETTVGVQSGRIYPKKAGRDACVSAPTGSGKTLSYVVPIVEILSKRIVTRLRALIILPTRDLVTQVRDTLEAVSKGSGLKIATATGSQSFATEQAQLMDSTASNGLMGGKASRVDILICTPGRLIDHLNGTPGFHLADLRFLVIDEADRLLTQSFQDWLHVVLAATRAPHPTSLALSSSASSSSEPLEDPRTVLLSSFDDAAERLEWDGKLVPVSQCQKLLFSATLTRDPSKIAALRLNDPQYFLVQSITGEGDAAEAEDGETFAIPANLKEHYLVLPAATKPLHLLSLLHRSTEPLRSVLCFTKSVESAARLVRLLETFEALRAAGSREKPLVVVGYSSDLGGAAGKSGDRAKVLKRFKDGEIDVLVCSDLIARGIDISSVSHVVSYDVPVDMRKYVHRVGRTARAGRDGSAWSLVESQEARHFKALLREAKHWDKLKKVVISEEELQPFQPTYEAALVRLRDAST